MQRTFMVLYVVFGVCAWAPGAVAAGEAEKVSKPFEYAGYSSPKYSQCAVSQAYVATPDGEQLAVDIYVPADAPAGERFPVILQYTPYRRSTIDPKTGKVRDLLSSGTAAYFTSYGYAMVGADMRGTGASTGWLMDFIPELWQDGKTIVDWIAAQPWCDGNVGMMGASYLGWSQTATASQQPEALKCIMPAVIPLDGYTGEVYPGGIYLQIFLKSWSEWMYPVQRNFYLPDDGILRIGTGPLLEGGGHRLLVLCKKLQPGKDDREPAARERGEGGLVGVDRTLHVA